MKGSLLLAVVACGGLLAGPAAATTDGPVCGERCVLVNAVAAALTGPGTAAEGRAPLVEPQRWSTDHMWAFGATASLPRATEGPPAPTLFLAQQIRHRWTVTLLATEEFAAAVNNAPRSVVDGPERVTLSRKALESTQSVDTGLALPWQAGQGWAHHGLHGDTGDSRPFNAIDFYGGDGIVRASGPGRLYRLCTSAPWPFVFVVHDNGWTTGYYHIRDITGKADGASVSTGEYLGRIGTELPCGGHATGPHVHWTLWQGRTPIAVDNKTVGGWTWHEGPVPYSGYADRNGAQVPVDQCCALTNYG